MAGPRLGRRGDRSSRTSRGSKKRNDDGIGAQEARRRGSESKSWAFEALSPWNCSSPWRSSAAGAALPTRRSRTSSIRSGCHPPDPRKSRRSPRLPALSCRRRPASLASLPCNQVVSVCKSGCVFFLGLAKRCIGVERGTLVRQSFRPLTQIAKCNSR